MLSLSLALACPRSARDTFEGGAREGGRSAEAGGDGVFALRHRDAVRDHDWRAARIATRVCSIDPERSKGFRPFSEVCGQQEAGGDTDGQTRVCVGDAIPLKTVAVPTKGSEFCASDPQPPKVR